MNFYDTNEQQGGIAKNIPFRWMSTFLRAAETNDCEPSCLLNDGSWIVSFGSYCFTDTGDRCKLYVMVLPRKFASFPPETTSRTTFHSLQLFWLLKLILHLFLFAVVQVTPRQRRICRLASNFFLGKGFRSNQQGRNVQFPGQPIARVQDRLSPARNMKCMLPDLAIFIGRATTQQTNGSRRVAVVVVVRRILTRMTRSGCWNIVR